ncbi:short chain dehydrogenase/ reductase [Microthyrium microscopicum]|uniref:Short chain dehydrogenase/ reductase n=1 Tax=Microthyrium microscopicum TaxID=703497 RepID=A0A6A6TYE9_9PEZI|nr:short chain dehydrogenase/ reductase [Microthyrium microscopicum]
MSTNLLSGVAFITGAGSGIGQAAAIAFVNNGVRKLVMADVSQKGMQATKDLLKDTKDLEIEAIEMDVSNEESVVAGMKQAVKRFGRIDYALNNAGIGGPLTGSGDMSLAQWEKTLGVNTNGVFLCQKEEVNIMLKQEDAGPRKGRGVIINTASMLGLVAMPNSLPATCYVTSKHAVIGMTKSDGIVYAPKGIRINAICPGHVETPMQSVTPDGAMATEIARIPRGRCAKPEEIADAMVFLASPLSSYMNGTAIVVDGGYTAY